MSGSAHRPEDVLSVRIRKALPKEADSVFTLDAEFCASPGFTILFGASGAGKTSLLDSIAGLLNPDEGRIVVGDTILFDSRAGKNLPPNLRSVGYLVQTLALFPHMSVAQNVEYGLADLTRAERESLMREILASFRIDELAERRPGKISGGERQRAALARALVRRPRVLLLDEPLTALDTATKGKILDDLRDWNRQHRIPILYVTHNREEAFGLGEQVLVMDNGHIVAQGAPQDVLGRPRSEGVAQLAGMENIFDCTVSALHSEQGTMSCEIAGTTTCLEVPLVRTSVGQPVRVGIRAGDILVAASAPQNLSARNILEGTILSLRLQDVTVIAKIDCGIDFVVHLTPGARQALQLETGKKVWIVAKTFSCHVLQ